MAEDERDLRADPCPTCGADVRGAEFDPWPMQPDLMDIDEDVAVETTTVRVPGTTLRPCGHRLPDGQPLMLRYEDGFR